RETAAAVLREKLPAGQGGRGGGDDADDSWAASAADWALMLTGTLARWREAQAEPIAQLKRLAARLGEPVVRTAVRQAMRILASQFVVGETIEEAVTRSRASEAYRFSYDMLGEAARTGEDAARYFDAHCRPIP